jgi:MIP family channel proteins
MKFRALLAEFIGTFALIFVGVLSIYHLSSAPAGLIGIALAHGLAIACLASATAAVSGGHLNPAVTFGLLLAKRIDPVNAIGYIVAQCLGGIVAGYAAVYVTVGSMASVAANGTPSLVSADLSPMQGIVAEAIATFFLVFVVLGTAVDRRAPKMGALFIGLTVTMGILAIGPLTGGALNPARWIGSAVAGGKFENALVYIIGPLLGAAIASLVYTLFLEDKQPLAPSDPIRVDPQG